jgi:hypothetical protein
MADVDDAVARFPRGMRNAGKKRTAAAQWDTRVTIAQDTPNYAFALIFAPAVQEVVDRPGCRRETT